MIITFFQALIKLWITNQRYSQAVKEAVFFLQWVREDLKPTAWLPARNAKDILWRHKRVMAKIKKMPVLSDQFFIALKEIKDYPPNFSRADWTLICIKKDNVQPMVCWLKGIETHFDIDKLKTLLILSPPIRADWKVKKNSKRKQSQ